MIIEIKSRSNPRLKELIANREGYFFFEGKQLVRDLVERNIQMNRLIVHKRFEDDVQEWQNLAKEIWLVSDPVMGKLSSLKTPADFLAVVHYESPEFQIKNEPVTIVLDRIQDPANAGTVFRCAAAFGFGTVIFCGESVKPTNSKFIRTAQTSIFDIRFQHYPDINNLIHVAKSQKTEIYLTSSKASTRSLDLTEIKTPALIVFGNEGQGLDPSLFDRFPVISISQTDTIDSLNVGVSACIIMHELRKSFPVIDSK